MAVVNVACLIFQALARAFILELQVAPENYRISLPRARARDLNTKYHHRSIIFTFFEVDRIDHRYSQGMGMGTHGPPYDLVAMYIWPRIRIRDQGSAASGTTTGSGPVPQHAASRPEPPSRKT